MIVWLTLCCAMLGCDTVEVAAVRVAPAKAKPLTAATTPAQTAAEPDDEVLDPIEAEQEQGDDRQESEGMSGNPFLANATGLSSAKRAVDEIASEIYESISLKPVLVVWLFDATSSAQTMRQEVVARLEQDCRVFGEAMKSGHVPAHELHWSAIAFGQKPEMLLPEPTTDSGALIEAVKSILEDNSGMENTFSAIDKAADEFVPHGVGRERYVFFIIVSDEMGDDADRVDAVASRLKKLAVQCYAIGPAAPFGYEGSLTPVAEVENWRQKRQGPESRELELVDVTASGRSQAAALMDSGCGPFALTYLTLQTGGRFFIVHQQPDALRAGIGFSPARDIVQFDPHVVARYLPEYVSAQEYQRLQTENRARQALNQAAKLPNIALATDLKREFAQTDPAALKRQLDEAQRAVARLEPRLRQFYDTLAPGENDRERLPPRWQATYDLAMGRVLAARARLEGYNSMLARLKSNNTFRQATSTRWVLTESETFASDSVLNKLTRRAHDYLERVVSVHSGTPWAWLAEQELQVPMAWNWEEK